MGSVNKMKVMWLQKLSEIVSVLCFFQNMQVCLFILCVESSVLFLNNDFQFWQEKSHLIIPSKPGSNWSSWCPYLQVSLWVITFLEKLTKTEIERIWIKLFLSIWFKPSAEIILWDPVLFSPIRNPGWRPLYVTVSKEGGGEIRLSQKFGRLSGLRVKETKNQIWSGKNHLGFLYVFSNSLSLVVIAHE